MRDGVDPLPLQPGVSEHSAWEALPGPVLLMHPDGRLHWANTAARRFLNAKGQLPVLDTASTQRWRSALARSVDFEIGLRESLPGGEAPACHWMVQSRWQASWQMHLCVLQALCEQTLAETGLQHLAFHDALTGLLNRATFMQRLGEAIQQAATASRQLALLFIDLDNFKRVNDSLGHLQGDDVLRTVADRIRACLRPCDAVGRFGGDEFVVLLSDIHERHEVLVVLMALLSVVEVPVQADGHGLSVTPSIGVAMYPEHGHNADTLLQHADTAMYLAKSGGRATYEFYEPGMGETALADLRIESELAQAIERNEFVLHYQPQLHASTGALLGLEALVRWQHPQRGLLGPDAFIDVAERHRLMLPLGDWVLNEAARQARVWHDSGVAAVPIAINLSAMQFRMEGFVDSVRQALARAGLPGHSLEIELTERMLIEELQRHPDVLPGLRQLGVPLALDDFGTGYTSLTHLTQLQLDKIKIDQSFVSTLPHDGNAAAITRAVVQMAHGLGLRVAAEGVRNLGQWQLLAHWGCDEVQGEAIGLPMPAAALEAWLAARSESEPFYPEA